MPDPIDQDLELKTRLPRTFRAFFSGFGSLLAVQRLAILPILSGKNLVLYSPSASGKTEAILAPLVERLWDRRAEGLKVLFISPTRALVNDLFRRLKPCFDAMGLDISRKTLDSPEFDPDKPPFMLILTPESFDSLLCRHPASLGNVEGVCLDELHLLDGTSRGDQLRVLLERLCLLRKEPISSYATSATISDPERLGRRYFADFETISLPSEKEIVYSLVPFEESMSNVMEKIREDDLRKVLLFCNSRREAEEVSVQIRRRWSYPQSVFVHHASLSKPERLAVERAFNRERVALCASTMTLELGIDIGDIDAVFLLGPPGSVRSLLQRIGRGNRRGTRVLACGIYRNEWERIFFEVLFELAKSGLLEEERYCPSLSVAVQQVISYTYQRRRRGNTLAATRRALQPLGLSEPDLSRIIDHLVFREYLKRTPEGLLYPGERSETLYRRGSIHSNIESQQDQYEVIDQATGRTLGVIEKLSPTFLLQGRLWEMVEEKEGKVYARAIERHSLSPGTIFRARVGVLWDFRLGKDLKRHLIGAQDREIPVYSEGDTTLLFHFLGPLFGFLWERALLRRKIEALDCQGVYLAVRSSSADLFDVSEEELRDILPGLGKLLQRSLNVGRFFYLLPPDLKQEALACAVDIGGFVRILRGLTPTRIEALPEIMDIVG